MTPLWDQALCLLAVFIAASVRGYAGFGFSAISIGLMSLWRPADELVPIIFMLEVPASLLLLREALRAYSGRWLQALVGGSAFGIPLGIALLSALQGPWLQLAVSGTVCAGASAVRLGWHPRHADTSGFRWLTGFVSGILNGLSALGGIACAVMLYASTLTPLALRATLTLLFLFTDLYGLVLAWLAGLLQPHMLGTAALWALPLALGIFCGSRFFHASDTSRFRARIFGLLTLLGAVGMVKAVLSLPF